MNWLTPGESLGLRANSILNDFASVNTRGHSKAESVSYSAASVNYARQKEARASFPP